MDLLNILKLLEPNAVAYSFIAVLVVAFCMAIFSISRSKHSRFQHFAPNFLTTVGILGTFVGISIGLAEFDTRSIDESIPRLLDGLKTAFITSIVGMTFAIVTRAYSTWSNRSAEAKADEVGAEDIHSVLLEIRSGIIQTNSQAERLRHAIAGDGDASVVTQLQKVRTELTDNSKELRNVLTAGMNGQSIGSSIEELHSKLDEMGDRIAEEFRGFAEKVSEIGSKQLIQALEEVIRDFNKNLMEQFGENFKHLDASVQKLVVWQDNYSEQLGQMDRQFQETVKGLVVSKEAVAQIAENSASIPESMDSLVSIMESAGLQLRNLEAHLEVFADMREKATEAMPVIREKLDEIMESIRESVKKASDHYEIMLDDSEASSNRFKEIATEMSKRIAEETSNAVTQTNAVMTETIGALQSGAEAIQEAAADLPDQLETANEQMSSQLKHAIQEAFEDQNSQIQKLHGGLRDAVATAADDQSKLITELTRNLDEVMQQEVTRVIQLMANNLAAITGKFVDDYTDLTNKMGQVVQANRRVTQ